MRLVETAYAFLIFLIATVEISMECEMKESHMGFIKHLHV